MIMRQDGELVSFKGTDRLISKKKLNNWQIMELKSHQESFASSATRHLLYDKQAAVLQSWKLMVKTCDSFLLKNARRVKHHMHGIKKYR